ncbi:hypothetical protein Tco_1186822 [Tanacetum coccineum]
MPYPRFTKVIINHFLSIQKSVPKTLPFGLHKIKDDDVLSRMKFVRIGEDVQEYGRAIPKTMLTDDIKQSETYQMFIKYSTGLIPLKKTRGKGDTSSMSKKISPDPSQKLKGVQTLTPEEQLATDTMQALKASRKSSRCQPLAGGSSEGTDEEEEKKDDDDADDDKSIDLEKTVDEETDDKIFS